MNSGRLGFTLKLEQIQFVTEAPIIRERIQIMTPA